jgi:hypothetical protein
MSLFPIKAHGNRVLVVSTGAALAAAILVAGCGSNYRPVVTPVNPTGPGAQPNSLAIVVSRPSPTADGIATVIDYSGDTVMATAPLGPAPLTFALDETGTLGYTVNSDGTLTNFPATTQLQEKNITFSTLPATSQSVNLFAPSAGLWVADQDGNVADILSGSPGTFKLAVPVAATPTTIVGAPITGQRQYVISLNNTGTPTGSAIPYTSMVCNTDPSSISQNGEADAIEVASYTVSARIPLGKCPVYGIESSDLRRLFILNRGSDTVTVINSQNNTLDSCTPFTNQNGQLVNCHPTLPLSTGAVSATGITPPNGTSGMTPTAQPVYAEYIPASQELVIANYAGGTISIIDASLDQYGNDSQTFGTTYTVKVGNTSTPNPASVTVLADGSRAYTANQNDDGGTGNGTVSIVNLTSHTLEKTLSVVGHPRTVVSTSNSLYGKVYAAAPDSPYLSIVRTDQDIIDTTVLVQGNILDVRVSTQNGSSGNANITSRRPGAGQPCYLPGPNPEASLTACQTL